MKENPITEIGREATHRTYVLCFVFSLNFDCIILIDKTTGPANLIGKANALGGKVEDGETTEEAATRETGQEAGIYIDPKDWEQFFYLRRG